MSKFEVGDMVQVLDHSEVHGDVGEVSAVHGEHGGLTVRLAGYNVDWKVRFPEEDLRLVERVDAANVKQR